MIIKATSYTIRSIWLFFLFIILFCIVVLGTLAYGIRIESLELSPVKFEQLYIKLDKKLIVKVDSLHINSTSQESNLSLQESAKIIDNFFLVDQLFESVDVEHLHYNNEIYKFSYTQNTFFVESNTSTIHMQFTPTGKNAFDIAILDAKIAPFHLTFSGKASVDLEKKHFSLENTFEIFNIQGIALVDAKQDLLHYHLQSENFTHENLSQLMNFIAPKIALDAETKAWIHENVIAKNYKLHFIEGLYNLKTNDFFPKSIYAKASLDKADVVFAPNVPAAHVEHADITLKDDRLSFDIMGATYEDKILNKVDLALQNLSKGTKITIDLQTNAALDSKIHKILHAFKINIPLTQTAGLTQSTLRLEIKFVPYSVKATGLFRPNASTFLLDDGMEIASKYGEIALDDTLVRFKNTHLRHKNLFDINASGTFDTKTSRFSGLADINSLALEFGKTTLLKIANLKQQETSLAFEKNKTTILLPTFSTSMIFEKNLNQFECKDLKKLYPYSALMKEMSLQEGTISLHTKDFQHFDADVFLTHLQTPFIDNGKMVNELSLALSTDGTKVDIKTPDRKLLVHMDKDTTVHLNDLNISVSEKSDSTDMASSMTILGKNSSFELEGSQKKILSDSYTLKLKGKDIHLNSSYKKTHFELEKKKKLFLLHASAMDALFANALFAKSFFHQGTFSLQMEGADDTHNQGTFILQKTYIKDLKFFNNLMATINTVPSLVFFSDPKFSTEGYFVDNGYVEFERVGEKFKIKEIHLKGSSADIFGVGTVDMATDSLHLDLQIRTLKSFSSVLDKIPLVGGLILGDDKKISTNITVTGPLDNPSIETHLVSDTLMAPVNIIKRTIELPLELFK